MTEAAAGTAVTGASYSDYLTLYEQVKSFKPKEILECGTGITTVVLAQALLENARETAVILVALPPWKMIKSGMTSPKPGCPKPCRLSWI